MFKLTILWIESWNLIEFKDIWSKDFGRVWGTKNKYLEMQLMHDGALLGLELDLHWKGMSHAGPSLSVAFLTFQFDINIYDHRHWDHDKDTWEIYANTA